MTLVISAEGLDFVVIGADSRGTLQDAGGTRVEINTMVKLFPVTPHTVVLICGEAGPATYLVELLKEELGGSRERVGRVAARLAKISREEAKLMRSVPTHPDYFPSFTFIVAGLELVRGRTAKPRSFCLRSLTGYRLESSQGGFMIDGKPMIPAYIFAKEYRPNLSVEDLTSLVVQTLYETTMIDGDVGGELRVGVIDRAGWRQLSQEDVKGKIKPW